MHGPAAATVVSKGLLQKIALIADAQRLNRVFALLRVPIVLRPIWVHFTILYCPSQPAQALVTQVALRCQTFQQVLAALSSHTASEALPCSCG